MHAIIRVLGAIEARIALLPYGLTAAALVLLAIVKQGIAYVQMFDDRFFTETPPALELPDLLFARSLLVTRAFNIQDPRTFQVLSIVAVFVVLGVAAWLLSRRLPKGPALIAFAAICLGQIGLMLLGQFGREDTWLILGAVVLMVSGARSWPAWVAGSAIMSLANPGQAFIAVLLLLMLAITPRFRSFLLRAFVALSITATWMLAVYALQSGNQVDSIGTYWLTGINGFLVSGPLRAYSIYGILWLGVIALLFASRRGSLAVYVIVLVVAPLLLVLLTGDGTRVGVGVTLLMVLALVITGAPSLEQWFDQHIGSFAVTALVLILLVSPTVNIYEFDAVMPWEWMKYRLGEWALATFVG